MDETSPDDARAARRSTALAIALFAVVFGILYAPVLGGGSTIAHADALSVGLPLQTEFAEGISEGRVPLWTNRLLGGHPIFAEGQGAYAHPMTWLLFAVLPTLYAHGLLHWLCGCLAAFGTFGLCRALGRGVAASLFGALALGTSQGWLPYAGNATIAGATAWVPFALWGFERWWRRPTAGRAATFGIAVAAIALAGYPQAVHATAISAAILALVRAFDRRPDSGLRTGTLVAAPLVLAVAAGLSAVQWLPTLELVTHSIRASGVELAASPDATWQLRGLLLSVGRRTAPLVPGLGSPLVCALALAALALRPDRSTLAHALAAFVLLQLGMADHSPLYRVLRGVLPGLDSFRSTQLYGAVALVSVAVLAASAVDRLARPGLSRVRLLATGAGVAVIVGSGCVWLHVPGAPAAGYALAVLGLAAVAALVAGGRARLVPAALLGVLLLEVALVRWPLQGDFVPVARVRTEPGTARFLHERGVADYEIVHVPHFYSYLGFASPSSPDLTFLVKLFLASLDAGSNLIFDVPSLDANLALVLDRRAAAGPRIEADLRGQGPRAPGRRLADLLGARFVVVHRGQRDGPYAPDLHRVYVDPDTHFEVLENTHARPRLQLHAEVESAAGLEDALSRFAQAGGALLVLEDAPEARTHRPDPDARLEPLERSPERVRVVVESREPVWLFVADAPYPGWRARVDGEPVRVFAANVLGKAVEVPAGQHEVELRFVSTSIRAGAAISALTLVGLGLGAWWRRR